MMMMTMTMMMMTMMICPDDISQPFLLPPQPSPTTSREWRPPSFTINANQQPSPLMWIPPTTTSPSTNFLHRLLNLFCPPPSTTTTTTTKSPPADVVLVLGGSFHREEMAVQLYRDGLLGDVKANAPCIISSGAMGVSHVTAIGES